MNREQVDLILKVAKVLAPRYTFGHYDKNDIEQECFVIMAESNALDKYDESRGSLENFIYVHLNNRLQNFLRKNYYRKTFLCIYCDGLDPECENCERRRWKFAVKKHLMEPIDIDKINCETEPNAYHTYNILEKLELDEIFTLINKHLEIYLRIDYLKMLEGLHVPKNRREIIEGRILDILEKHGYGE